MNFFLDANMPYSVLKVFEELKLEAMHAKDVGLSQADDTKIMEYAIRTKSILVTKDLEFGNARLFPKHFGIVILRLPYFYKASQITNSLKDFFNLISIKDLENSITVIKLGRYRIRKFD